MKTISLDNAQVCVANLIQEINKTSLIMKDLGCFPNFNPCVIIAFLEEMNKKMETLATENVEQKVQEVEEKPIVLSEKQKEKLSDLLQNALDSAFDSMSFCSSDMESHQLAELEVDYSNDYANITLSYNQYNMNDFIKSNVDVSELKGEICDEFFTELERELGDDGSEG